jgi:hypothetical protein
MKHTPTGKIYIGSLKDDKRWEKYTTSSKVVSKMMKANPEEWTREILCFIELDEKWTYQRGVELEERLIKRTVSQLGWDAVWNKHYGGQSHKYAPSCQAKRRAAIKASFTPERRLQLSQRALTQVGRNSPSYKGTVVGTNIETGETVYFDGKKELQTAGFHQGSVWKCIHGDRKSHKGYTWKLFQGILSDVNIPSLS